VIDLHATLGQEDFRIAYFAHTSLGAGGTQDMPVDYLVVKQPYFEILKAFSPQPVATIIIMSYTTCYAVPR
jgi:hypothetical protein